MKERGVQVGEQQEPDKKNRPSVRVQNTKYSTAHDGRSLGDYRVTPPSSVFRGGGGGTSGEDLVVPRKRGSGFSSTTQRPLSSRIKAWLSLAEQMTEGMVICRAAELRRETEGSRIKIVVWKTFFFFFFSPEHTGFLCRCFGSAAAGQVTGCAWTC